ncbi:MAG: response regulator [Lachnospiraceae bacterium]|nr:response regulator [Lachnospiraceae bacterium]
MRNVLLVDDEPLARIGMQSMLSTMHDIKVTGSVSNGALALEFIRSSHPDIVITDIKMPVMDGLTLLKTVCESDMEKRPAFIILTSYEEFDYVKSAIKYDACYYLVKMELSPQTLSEALKKAYKTLDMLEGNGKPAALSTDNIFVNRFYYNLLSYGFHSEEAILDAVERNDRDFPSKRYLTVAVSLADENSRMHDHSKSYSTYMSVTSTLKSSLSPSLKAKFVPWSQDIIGIIILLNDEITFEDCSVMINDAEKLIKQYLGIKVTCSFGTLTESMILLSSSFSSALASLDENMLHRTETATIDITSVSRRLIRAFDSLDDDLMEQTLKNIELSIDTLTQYDSISLVSCVINVIINCLNDGESMLENAFSNYSGSFRSLYSFTGKEQIKSYLINLKSCIENAFARQKNDSKNKIVLTAKQYIREHVYEKLSLSDVALHIGVSQNYLSTLFGSYSDLGFSEYVMSLKIQKARETLEKQNIKVYELSDMLGFENPQYFSKVYKKYTGYSPSDTPAKI